MHLRIRKTSRTLLVAATMWALAMPAMGQSVASFEVGPSSIDFRPQVSFERAVITVSSPTGEVVRRELEPAAMLSLNLRELFGANLPEGSYRAELTLQPKLDAATREQLAAARASGDEAAVLRLKAEGRLPAKMIQSARFAVVGGSLVGPGQSEPPSLLAKSSGEGPGVAARTTFTDSLCVGFDCPAAPSFSDTTILMMEDNTRIKFDDGSTAAGFPDNDWEIQANSGSSGGGEFLAINDCGVSAAGGCADDPLFVVEAGAPANSLFVDSSGRVGLRTATPVLDLHISTGNTPALRLEQNAASGFTAQTWDIAGNEANFFVRDVTAGSRLPLRIRPGAPSSSLDISADGDIGVGTATTDASIDLRRSASASEIMATTFSSDGALFPNFIQRRAGGSSTVPTATQADNIIGSYSFRGHDGTAFSTNNIARLEVRAEQNFTSTAQGTRMIFQTTANGASSPSTRMVIKNDGAVGIGTNTPTAGSKLEVSGGSIRVTGGSFIDDGTTLSVPDYVFEPDYELRPLEELASFIAANKHLPGVPSRDDVKKDGLNLSQFQMRLLEKVEELTLYTLQQNETIAELKARLAALEQAKQ